MYSTIVLNNRVATLMSYLGWAAAGPQSVCRFSQSSFWCSLHGSSGSQSERPAQSSPPGPVSPLWTGAEQTHKSNSEHRRGLINSYQKLTLRHVVTSHGSGSRPALAQLTSFTRPLYPCHPYPNEYKVTHNIHTESVVNYPPLVSELTLKANVTLADSVSSTISTSIWTALFDANLYIYI